MRRLYNYLLITLLFFTVGLSAQDVPNGGFEDWLPTVIWTNNPADWITDNTEVTAPVFPDSAAYAGELCMTLVPDANGLGVGDAIAETTFEFTDTPDALVFYAKWNYVAGQVGVTVTYLNGTEEAASVNWSPSDFESSSDWQLIQLMLPQEDILFTHCKISCYALVGDLATATISFDEMQFGVANGIIELDNPNVSLSPNPCIDYLNIDMDKIDTRNFKIKVMDPFGRVVYKSDFKNEINTSLLSTGHYVLVMESGELTLTKNFVVER